MYTKLKFAGAAALAILAGAASAADKEIYMISCGTDTNAPAKVQTEQIAAWVKANPGYTVREEYVAWGQCQDKVLNLAGAGTPPAIASLGSRTLKQLSANDLIVPVNLTSAERNSYEPSIRRTFEFDGKAWGVPRAFSTKALYWNKTLFAQAGVRTDRGPQNWDEVIAAAKAVSEKTDAKGIGLAAASFNNTMHQFLNWMYSNGGDVLDSKGNVVFDSSNVVETFQLYKDLTPYAQDGPTAYNREQLSPLFANKQIAMYVTGRWGRVPQNLPEGDEWGVVPIPAGPQGQQSTLLITDSLVVFKKTDVSAAAVKLVKFLTSPQNQSGYEAAADLTPLRAGANAEALIASDPTWKVFIEAIPTGGPEPLLTDYVAMEDVFTDAIQGVILGEITPEEAAEDAAEELEAIK